MSAFDKIIGYESIKKELRMLCDILKDPDKYQKLGVEAPRAIMLDGEPGVGKSLMAQCLIEESGLKSYTIRKEKPNGAFIDFIRETFEQARANAPSIVFLDDMDKFANEDDKHPNAEEYVTVQACIDECRDARVFSFATVNNRYCLPDSLLRAGRFDKCLEIEAPTGRDAYEIVAHYLNSKKLADDIDVEEVVRLMINCSSAELEAVINEAGILAGFRGSDRITHEDMRKACIRRAFEGLEETDEDKQNVDEHVVYHEAGHLVIAELLRPGSVTLASVCRYYGSPYGVVRYDGPKNNTRKSDIEYYILSGLGGKAAVDTVFGAQDVGSDTDLGKVFVQVETLVNDMCCLGFDSYIRNDPSEYQLQHRDRLIASELDRYYGEAKQMLIEHRTFLDAVRDELVEKKTLTFRDIEHIRAEIEPVDAA